MARGHIRQRSPNHPDHWTIYVYLGRNPKTGHSRYRTEVFRGTRRGANRRLTELLWELDNGDYIEPSGMTTGEFLRRWLCDYAEVRVRRQTHGVYRRFVELHIIPSVGHIPVEKLSSLDVQSVESGCLLRGLSPRTVLHCHEVFSQALKWGVRMGVVKRNVANVVDAPKPPRYEARTLRWDEIATLLSAAVSTPYYSIILIALLTGLRRSEVLGLMWRDVDFEKSIVSVNHSLVQMVGSLDLGPPKSGRPRAVSLPAQAVGCLFDLWESRRDGLSGPGNMVFCRDDGSPIRPGTVSRFFGNLAARAGFKGFRFHDLRHTHATLMLGEGVHLKIVSERLGHAGIGITADLYSHVAPSLQQEAAAQFSRRFDLVSEVDLQIDLHAG